VIGDIDLNREVRFESMDTLQTTWFYQQGSKTWIWWPLLRCSPSVFSIQNLPIIPSFQSWIFHPPAKDDAKWGWEDPWKNDLCRWVE
jgi:hypothetical protein